MLQLSSKLFWWFVVGDVFFVSLNAFPVGTELIDLSANLDHEANLATWYVSAKLLLTAVICWAISFEWTEHKRLSQVTSIVFLAASITETAMIHERSFGAAYTLVHGNPPITGLPGGWVVYFAPLVAAVVTALLWFVLRAVSDFPGARFYLLAGLALWIIAIGAETMPYLLSLDSTSAPRAYSLIEESAELLGVTAFFGGLSLIARTLSQTRLHQT